MADSSYFVRVPDSELVKLTLLESAKESLLCSKEYFRLAEIRKEKDAVINDLKTQASDMISTIEKLSSALPDSEQLLQEFQKSKKKSSSGKKKTASKKAASKKASGSPSSRADPELDRLNEALADIERKLERLS